MKSALVLSGGGAKGAFEVGALQYVYEKGYFASAICSTSVGSVNAIQLAKGGDAQSQKAAYDGLVGAWRTLILPSDMCTLAPWLNNISTHTREILLDLFNGRIYVPQILADTIFFPPYLVAQVADLGIDLGELINGFKTAKSLLTLEPINAMIAKLVDRNAVSRSGVELRLVAVSLDSGKVRYVRQDGGLVETDNTPIKVEAQTCGAERAAYAAAVEGVKAAGTLMRQARTVEDRREAQAEIRQANARLALSEQRLNQCLAAATAATVAEDLVVDIVVGAIASASIPCIFPAITMGDEAYVDGGVRWVLPLKAALDLEPQLVIAISAGPLRIEPTAIAFANANLLQVVERSFIDIMLWETEERHLEVAKLKTFEQGKRVWVVAPRVNVIDLLNIDPGLIEIAISYGYMCAADVLSGTVESGFPFAAFLHPGITRPFDAGTVGSPLPRPATPIGTWVDEPANKRAADLADAIALCRRYCWDCENSALGIIPLDLPFSVPSELSLVPNPSALDQVRLLKTLIGLLVDARQQVNGVLPPESATWGDAWERHQVTLDQIPGVGKTPWDAFDSPTETRAAATRPRVLLAKLSDSAELYLLDPVKHRVVNQAGIGGPVAIVPDPVRSILDALPVGADIV